MASHGSSFQKTFMGAAGGSSATDVTDVFSTFLYNGNDDTQAINNGIDLDGEGGLVWIKPRDLSLSNRLMDSARGPTKYLVSDTTGVSQSGAPFSFGSNGFSLTGGGASWNQDTSIYVSWTFRKASKFFDVVTYSGSGSAKTVAHSLGSAPGMIIIKNTGVNDPWAVYHRANTAAPQTDYLVLNTSATTADSDDWWNDTAPTSSVFTVGTDHSVNANGENYVAYLFAHNDGDGGFGPDADQDIIKCGGYAGNATSVDLGFEPQFIIVKRTNATENWMMFDTMRGWVVDGNSLGWLMPNNSNRESALTNGNFGLTSTGFSMSSGYTPLNSGGSSDNYIYIAIRRGPLAVPEVATKVFGLNEYSGNDTTGTLITSSGTGVVDAAFINSSATVSRIASRLTGVPFLSRSQNSAEINSNTRFKAFDDMNGFFVGNNSQVNGSSNTYLSAMWTRAPSFFDVVPYTGTGSPNVHAPTLSHNLTVPPEFVWVKKRSGTGNWAVSSQVGTGGVQAYLDLNNGNVGTLATTGPSNTWSDYFTATQVIGNGGGSSNSHSAFPVTHLNVSGSKYIMYLFATAPGVSKVGSYTGNGSSQTIDCGFTSGARYVLVKRTNANGDWVEFNSEYGIVAGNEKAWRVNAGGDTGSEALDIIDPANSGFIINQESSYNLNVNNATYIFNAIA